MNSFLQKESWHCQTDFSAIEQSLQSYPPHCLFLVGKRWRNKAIKQRGQSVDWQLGNTFEYMTRATLQQNSPVDNQLCRRGGKSTGNYGHFYLAFWKTIRAFWVSSHLGCKVRLIIYSGDRWNSKERNWAPHEDIWRSRYSKLWKEWKYWWQGVHHDVCKTW